MSQLRIVLLRAATLSIATFSKEARAEMPLAMKRVKRSQHVRTMTSIAKRSVPYSLMI